MEPYDVIVNQPVVIDNVSESTLFTCKSVARNFLRRMNHHRPTQFLNANIFSLMFDYRDQASSRLVSRVIKFPNAFSQISKCHD